MELNQKKTPVYKVFYKDKLVIHTSDLGVIREDANFYTDLKIIKVSKAKAITPSYSMLQGKRSWLYPALFSAAIRRRLFKGYSNELG